MDKKTALYDIHLELKGKMVSYADYLLPVQYSSIIEEHLAVRNAAGVFDVSHMGEILIEHNALQFINYLVCNDVSDLLPKQIRYSPMLNEKGGIVDDLLIYCFSQDKCLLVVNAANKEKDYQWIVAHAKFGVKITDISDKVAQIALQGPLAQDYLSKYVAKELLPQKNYHFEDKLAFLNDTLLISKTGYTGSGGYEIYGNFEIIKTLFKNLVQVGVVPCGLGARDTLRLEAGLPLYGHEMTDDISPLDTGLERFCKFKVADFIGKDQLKDHGLTRVGLKIEERGILRADLELTYEGKKVGKTTSGTYLPSLKGSYAMAIVTKDVSQVGQRLNCQLRNKQVAVVVCDLPFYKREKRSTKNE